MRTLALAGSGSRAQTRGSHLGRFSLPRQRHPEGLRLVVGMYRGAHPPPGAGRVKGPAPEQAAVTGTGGSAAGTAALWQAPKGSRAKRGSAARSSGARAAPVLQRAPCGARAPAAAWHRSGAPLSPLHEGWTWPRVCQELPWARGCAPVSPGAGPAEEEPLGARGCHAPTQRWWGASSQVGFGLRSCGFTERQCWELGCSHPCSPSPSDFRAEARAAALPHPSLRTGPYKRGSRWCQVPR